MSLSLSLVLLPQTLVVVRLAPTAQIPTTWNQTGDFWSIVRTQEEISLVCDEFAVPPGMIVEKGWRVFKVNGPLSFDMVGVIASLSLPLANAGVSIFSISTYDTDYLMVKEEKVNLAIETWQQAGYKVI